ncbi:hypothetical protein D3C86_1557080 [compost metagenome]
MQLLPVKTVLAHHLIDELFGRRVIGEITAHLHDIVLRLQQKPAGGRASRLLNFLCFRFAATGSKHNQRGNERCVTTLDHETSIERIR